MTAVITLTAEQVASVLAQQGGAPAPQQQPPAPPVITPPPATPVPGNVKIIDVAWDRPTRQYTSSVGGFGPDDIIAARFTTGNVSTSGSLPRIAAAEYQGPPLPRKACLSKIPGDFANPILNRFGRGVEEGQSVTFPFALGTGFDAYYPTLDLNTTYYLNMSNEGGQAGDMFIDLLKPGGL